MLGLIFFVISLIALIFGSVQGLWLVAIVAAPVAILSFLLFLDIRGTEIDTSGRRIRSYRQFLHMRRGDWSNLNDYTEVRLVKDYFHVMMPGGVGRVGLPIGARYAHISSYDVLAYSENFEQVILLSEFAKHPDAVKFMETWAEKLSMESRDTYRELQASAVRNRRGRR